MFENVWISLPPPDGREGGGGGTFSWKSFNSLQETDNREFLQKFKFSLDQILSYLSGTIIRF